MDVNVVVIFNVKSDKLTSFTAIMQGVKSNLPTVSGCKGIKIYNDINHPLVFVLVETWDSEANHKSHIDNLIKSGEWDKISNHLSAEPISSYYRQI